MDLVGQGRGSDIRGPSNPCRLASPLLEFLSLAATIAGIEQPLLRLPIGHTVQGGWHGARCRGGSGRQTILLGIAGSWVGGFLAGLLGFGPSVATGLVSGVLGAILLLLVYRMVRRPA